MNTNSSSCNMTSYREDLKRKTGSGSFCLAKWYNATVWLNSGMTTSCHHPQAHKIDVEEVKQNPSALHNTSYKKLVRKQMQEGIRPKECEYCWKIEDLGENHVSDRYYKSAIYSEDELNKAFTAPYSEDFNLRTLEISFDSNCDLACSYCNASFSTKWQHDINSHGPYQGLISDVGYTYSQNGDWTRPYGLKNTNNPYVEAFWKWWEQSLQHSLVELRVTGGEATVSKDFWNLMKWYKENPSCGVRLAVNSNLANQNKIDKLIEESHHVKDFWLFTSNESVGLNAEYIRHGLVWDEWTANLRNCIERGNFKLIHVMLTVNMLCLASLTDFLDYIIQLQREYPNTRLDISFNILRFPSFQSIATLPRHLREQKRDHIREWLERNKDLLQSAHSNRVQAIIDYIDTIEDGHSRSSDTASRLNDLKNFFVQYDTRRKVDFQTAFANWPELLSWWNTLSPPIYTVSTVLHNELVPENPFVDEVKNWQKNNEE